MRVRTVTLEILRHGPSHNQLLSPLTQYLALSGQHEAVTLQIPWEHARFERELNVLRYEVPTAEGPARRSVTASDRADIAAQVSRIFEAVPGLIAGLAPGGDGRDVLTHVRLIFSASELALIPFEMSVAPRGFPSEGDALSTQSSAPLVMTREVRGATGHERPWPTTPRVLFAWADLDGNDVPWEEHRAALEEALRPWTGRAVDALDVGPAEALGRYLTVLENATLRSIAEACAAEAYTHVHVLAHGGKQSRAEHERFALLLRDAGGEADRVSPERLATALTGQLVARGNAGASFTCPTVVTLATCDSGNPGTPALPGASLAHALHAAGVPLVVGSLFPLTKAGSVTMTEALYRGLLAGDDPRVTLRQMRLALRTRDVNTHDWASVVAYASLPATIEEQALHARYEAARRGAWIVSGQIENLARVHEAGRHLGATDWEQSFRRLADDLERVARRLPVDGGYEIEGYGLLGSKDKRKAQALFRVALAKPELQDRYVRDSFGTLTRARQAYYRAVDSLADTRASRKKGAPGWVLTQALSVDAALGLPITPDDWRRACAAAEVELVGPAVDVAWAHGSLLELYLLRAFVTDEGAEGHLSWEGAERRARESAKKIADAVRLGEFIVESTRRQLERYATWWHHDLWTEQLARVGRPRDADSWKRFAGVVDEALRVLAKAVA